jgi:hypothetical protein
MSIIKYCLVEEERREKDEADKRVREIVLLDLTLYDTCLLLQDVLMRCDTWLIKPLIK